MIEGTPPMQERVFESSPVPLYHQVFVAVRDDILSGRYPAGSVMPPEHEVASTFKVSRITAKRALNELAARGLVRRERGRGTIVVFRPETVTPLVAGLENILAMGLETSVDLLEFDYMPADEMVAAALQVGRGAPVQHAVRVRSMDGLPFSYITTWLPDWVGQSFDRNDLSTQPLLLLLERSGITVTGAKQTIGAEAAAPVVARALGIEPLTALLRIERIVFGNENRPIEYIRALYNPERYQYRMELTRNSSETANTWEMKRESPS
jgi:GntR family transcriptional regulator